MSLVVVGLNHRTVPIGLLERMAVAPEGGSSGEVEITVEPK